MLNLIQLFVLSFSVHVTQLDRDEISSLSILVIPS